MRLSEYSKKLHGLAATVYQWLGALTGLDPDRRERIATFADAVSDTLARAADAMARLEEKPDSKSARRDAARELGRISGYVETIVDVLDDHLDGRKLAGVKRRLEHLETGTPPLLLTSAKSKRLPKKSKGRQPPAEEITPGSTRIDQLNEAEGYFRALADGLRA